MNKMTFSNLLHELVTASLTSHDKGVQLERLMKRYLTVDPQYKNRLAEIWLWPEWPDRWGPDVGIDLVAREHGSGDYWAIQCKFYDPAHALQKADIDSFFTASGKRFRTADSERGFSQLLIVATTDKWSKHSEQALENQTIPVTRLWFKDLADSLVDDMRLTGKKALRPHQAEAVANVLEGFRASDRGKLIMACGTGKTLAALRLTEQLTGTNGRVLFLTPFDCIDCAGAA